MSENNIFTKEEDYILIKLVRMFGNKKWKNISVYLSKIFPDTPKNQKICKNRWFQNLNPKINHKGWSLVEEFVFFESQKIIGNKWATISKLLPGRYLNKIIIYFDRTDNNIKNHFYSTLRKNIRRFLKDKSNFSCIKDKIKTFYTMIYAREKFNELKKFYDRESNTLDLKKAKRISNNDNINFDDSYITELICGSGGSLQGIDHYLTNLCLDLYESNSEMGSNKFPLQNFDINKKIDIDVIYRVISDLVLKNAITSCLKIFPSLQSSSQDNFEEKHKTNYNSELTISKKEKTFNMESYRKNSSESSEYVKEDKSIENVNIIQDFRKSNDVTHLVIKNPDKISQNIDNNTTQQNHNSRNNKHLERTSLSENKINSLVNNFTKKFTYETNIFDNIKNSNFLNISPESSSSNNILSHMISKKSEEGNNNNQLYNLFENFNRNSHGNSKNHDRMLLNLLELDKMDSNSSFINNELMDKLQSVNNFGLFKTILEKIIINNIFQSNETEKGNVNVGKNYQNSCTQMDNYDFIQNNNLSSNQISHNNNQGNGSVLNENEIHISFKKYGKIKKEKSNAFSNSNFLQNKTNRTQPEA